MQSHVGYFWFQTSMLAGSGAWPPVTRALLDPLIQEATRTLLMMPHMAFSLALMLGPMGQWSPRLSGGVLIGSLTIHIPWISHQGNPKFSNSIILPPAWDCTLVPTLLDGLATPPHRTPTASHCSHERSSLGSPFTMAIFKATYLAMVCLTWSQPSPSTQTQVSRSCDEGFDTHCFPPHLVPFVFWPKLQPHSSQHKTDHFPHFIVNFLGLVKNKITKTPKKQIFCHMKPKQFSSSWTSVWFQAQSMVPMETQHTLTWTSPWQQDVNWCHWKLTMAGTCTRSPSSSSSVTNWCQIRKNAGLLVHFPNQDLFGNIFTNNQQGKTRSMSGQQLYLRSALIDPNTFVLDFDFPTSKKLESLEFNLKANSRNLLQKWGVPLVQLLVWIK